MDTKLESALGKVDQQYGLARYRGLIHRQSIFAIGSEDHFSRARVHADHPPAVGWSVVGSSSMIWFWLLT